MTRQEIERTLKEDLGIKKEIVALKPMKEFPHNIPPYEGLATPGLCVQIGEVVREGGIFYTTRENHQCFEGLIATGVCELSREEFRKAVEEFIDTFPVYRDIDTAMDFYEKCITSIPVPPTKNKCLVVGPLSKVDDPDLALLFCTPKQADILVRIHSYLGEIFLRALAAAAGACLTFVMHTIKESPLFPPATCHGGCLSGLTKMS